MKYRIIIPLAALLLAACSQKEEKTKAVTEPEKFCLTPALKEKVEIVTLHEQPVNETFMLTGSVTYNADNVVKFSSLIEGIVTNTFFSLGDYVKKGQTLAEVRSTELNGLEAQKKTIESQLLVAKRQLESAKSMYKDGIASQKDLIEAQSQADVLKSSLDNVNSNLSLFSASPEKSVFRIIAPTDGYVISKNMSSGMQISDNTEALFTISNLKELWVMVNIYTAYLQDINVGMPVTIKVPGYPNQTFKGKIETLSQVFDADEHVLKARIVMKNEDLKLKPGMSADIILNKKSDGSRMVAAPAKALIFDNNQNYLLVYKNDCTLKAVNVQTAGANDSLVYIKSGIADGDKIISKNQLLIHEKMKN